MLYCIFSYIGFTILSITLRHLGLGIKNWEFWLILLLSVGLSLLGYSDGLKTGLEMTINAGI